MTTLVLAGVLIAAPMIVEARRAARNERAQLARGGVEPADDVYQWMRVAYPGAFIAMLVEGWWRGGASPLVLGAGLFCFAAGKLLKWWAILSLGPFWTFRVVVVPFEPLVTRGPYRWLRHPNYVGVVLELIGAGLMTGAAVLAPVVSVLFGILILRRIEVENRALESATRHARGAYNRAERSN
ncbi:MAG TPA: isoprenylcysteine carboxylmethyltransferase family protein [Vicinamibacterales bacterium]|jgi:methyltransferase